MYGYLSSLAKRRSKGGFWDDRNLGDVTFKEIQKLYSSVVFTLDNPLLGGTVYSTLEDMKALGITPTMTLNDWLASIGNRYFEVVYEPYELVEKTVRYRDAIRAGYYWQHIAANVSGSEALPLSDRPDLEINRQGTDYHLFTQSIIATVNGFAHRVQYNNGRAIVLEGGRTIMKADRNSIGFINFNDVAELEQIAIEPSMISDPADTDGLFNNTYISAGASLENKSVILSLGGYLHFSDDVCKVVNPEDGVIKIDWTRVNLLERLFDQRDYISLASLPLSTTSINEGAVTVNDLKADNVLTAYLTLPQSFLIVVDAPGLYKKQTALEDSGLYNVFYSEKEPVFPIQMHHGMFPETWVREEDGKFIISVHDGLKKNHMLYTGPWRGEDRVDPGTRPESQRFRPIALETEIGTQEIIWT